MERTYAIIGGSEVGDEVVEFDSGVLVPAVTPAAADLVTTGDKW